MTPPPLRVLLVDDNSDDRRLVERALQREFGSVEVLHIRTQKELDEALDRFSFDFVVTDYMLGWTDGLTVLHSVRHRYPYCPTIMYTGTGNEEVAVQAMKNGLDEYVIKSPQHLRRLGAAIRRAIERSEHRREMREMQRRMRELLDRIPVGVYRTAPDGEVLYANPAMCELLGFPEDASLVGRSLADVYVDPDDRRRWREALERRTLVRSFETRLRRADGVVIWVSDTARAIRAPSGEILYLEGVLEDITGRKRAMEALAESEARFATLFRSSASGIAVIRQADGEILEVNDAFVQMLGYQRDEVLGRTTVELEIWQHPEDRDRILAEVAEHGAVRDRVLEVRTKSRLVVTLLASVEAIQLGGEQCVVWMGHDISDRVRAERALRESEARLRQVMECAGDAVFLWDEAGHILATNQRAAELLGYSRDDLLKLTIPDIELRADRSRVVGPRLDALKPGEFITSEGTNRRKDGSTVPVEVRTGPLVVGGERLFVAVSRDVSERIEAQRVLKESEERYRLFFEHNPQPMWLHDVHTLRFLAVNQAAIRHYGYSQEEFLAMTTADLRAEGESPTTGDGAQTRDEELQRPERVRQRRKDGSVIDVEIIFREITFQSRRCRLVLAQDVTLRTRLEEQVRQSQKMEAVGRLAGGVAHDFNNLLTVILGESQLILLEEQLPPEQREATQEVKRAAERGAALTRQLLTFSRKQLLEPTVFGVHEVVTDMESMLRRLIGEHIALRSRLDAGNVRMDRGQLEQVLMNMVVNARDAMPDGGTLSIETTTVMLSGDQAQIHGDLISGEYVVLSVSDTGVGMSPEVKQHLFEPFFTTKSAGRGTGLGLATSYGIVQQAGGHISVYSEAGLGTTLNVYLPRVAQPAERRSGGVSASLPRGSETILVVEDDASLRAVARRVLERYGYHVLDVTNAEEALRALDEAQPSVDLMLTDVVLPGMSGRELAEHAASRHPDLKVLFASGYTDDVVFRHRLLEHGVAFIHKPFTLESLTRRVRDVLDEA